MFSLEVESDDDTRDLLVAELWEQGSTGVVETDLPGGRCLLRGFFDSDIDMEDLQRRFGGRIEAHPSRDWIAYSRESWRPLEVGAKFYLVPQWLDDPAPAGRLRIEINPGLACGTGYHEATQLCLEALEEYLRPGMTVLDVGTGAGILSIAAQLLGAKRVIACDLDPVAVEIARGKFPLFVGSADAVRAQSCDLIVANINADVAGGLAAEFLRCLAPGGRLIVSGFEALETPAVERAYPDGGVIRSKAAWRALVITRKA